MDQPCTEPYILAFGLGIQCHRCSALSKRTRLQCQVPAMKGKTKCAAHGGKSTGPRTAEGKARIVSAHLVHGEATRAARAEYRTALVRLAKLEEMGRRAGVIVGPRAKGPKLKSTY